MSITSTKFIFFIKVKTKQFFLLFLPLKHVIYGRSKGLWKEVVDSKYGGWRNLRDQRRYRLDSLGWRDLKEVMRFTGGKKILRITCFGRLGTGGRLKFL